MIAVEISLFGDEEREYQPQPIRPPAPKPSATQPDLPGIDGAVQEARGQLAFAIE